MGNLGDKENEKLTVTPTQIVTPPASGTKEVPGLEGSNILELVKSTYGMEKKSPIPRPLGQIEVPGLVESKKLELVRVFVDRKKPPLSPGSWKKEWFQAWKT